MKIRWSNYQTSECKTRGCKNERRGCIDSFSPRVKTRRGGGEKRKVGSGPRGKRAIYSVKSADWDGAIMASVEVCPRKWPWFRSGVANLPANEHQRKLEGPRTQGGTKRVPKDHLRERWRTEDPSSPDRKGAASALPTLIADHGILFRMNHLYNIVQIQELLREFDGSHEYFQLRKLILFLQR